MATLTLDVTDEEARRIEARARRENLTISEFLRRQANASIGGPLKDQRCEQRPGARFPISDSDEDDPIGWDVDFTASPSPVWILKMQCTRVSWAPIPEWREEDLEPDMPE